MKKGFIGNAIVIILLLLCHTLLAQTNSLIKKGNDQYDNQQYKDATQDYLKALQKDPNNTAGLFNLGNSLYQMKQLDSSRKFMTMAAGKSQDKISKSAANYNIGNTYMAQQKWQEAADAYKNTLRTNPQDADAKYNLSYAEQMLKKQQNNGGKNDKQDQKKQDQKQQQQQQQQDKKKNDKDKDKDKQEQQQQQDQDKKDKKDGKDQQPESQPSKLTQQQADQLLNALNQEEKKLQDKQQKKKGVPVKLDKDW